MPASTAIRRAATETLTIPTLRILSSAATEKERIAFVKEHIRAIELCGRRTIQHAWLVGRELAYIKEQRADLRGRAWVAFTKKHFDLGETQSFNLMRVSRGYPSLKSLPKGIESVRGAIADLQVRKEIEQAEGRAAGISNACRRSTGYADVRATRSAPTPPTGSPSTSLALSCNTSSRIIAPEESPSRCGSSEVYSTSAHFLIQIVTLSFL